ncbi:hypothetical protein PRZ48_013856 [Zasmidium cellare]|uniref:DUF1772 domain-containing protein n=1 Tax=Zasmidium cellare TaxID=395010 RepID=A0ABR0E2F9_ZASCE|nr:hypothetical protein PRZ48_013856 [Zasmidium cellare]
MSETKAATSNRSSILLPIVTGSVLSGAMGALSLMAVPVLLETTTDPTQLFHQWVTMYGYGHRVLPGLAIVTALLYARTARQSQKQDQPWYRLAIAGISTACIIPFTLIFMASTNNALFALHADAQDGNFRLGIEGGKALVTWWSRLHLMRSVMPLAGAAVGVSTLSTEKIQFRQAHKRNARLRSFRTFGEDEFSAL